jgi:hypothetical protein
MQMTAATHYLAGQARPTEESMLPAAKATSSLWLEGLKRTER